MNFFQLMLELQHIMEVVQALKNNLQMHSRKEQLIRYMRVAL